MPVHTTPRWAAERPRSASLPAYPVPTSSVERQGSALDTAVAAMGRGSARPVALSPQRRRPLDPRQARHQPSYPLPRSKQEQLAPRDFAALWAQAEDVYVARRRPAPPQNLRLPHEAPRAPSDAWPWPGGDLELVGGARRRYRLHRTAGALRPFLPDGTAVADLGIRGANSLVSLVSVHDTGPPRPLDGLSVPTPVFYLVCKTFALQDVPALDGGTRPYLRATSRDAIRREIDASMLPAGVRILDDVESACGETPLEFDDEREWPGAAGRKTMHRPPEATAVEPRALLRQLDASGEFVHVLYPLSQFDGLHVLHAMARHADAHPREARASRELLAHALMGGPLTSLLGMHQANHFHQDLKPANLLYNFVPFPADDKKVAQAPEEDAARGSRLARGGPDTPEPLWLLRADLVDFGHATPNNAGSMATGTLHTHAPESFIAAANYRNADPARGWLRNVSYFERWQDDVWAFGLLLMRTLTPSIKEPPGRRGEWWLSCPLVADYILDPQAKGGEAGAVVAGFVEASLNANHRTAQLFLQAWRPVHAQWTNYDERRRAGALLPLPRGNVLPTPNGHRIDEALGLVASTGFDFLGPLLEMTRPLGDASLSRPPCSRLIERYGEDHRAIADSQSYLRLCASGQRTLRRLFVGRFVPSSFAAQAEVLAAAATRSVPGAGRRHWAETGSWPRRPGTSAQTRLLSSPTPSTAHSPWPFAQPAGPSAGPVAEGQDGAPALVPSFGRTPRERGPFRYATYDSEGECLVPSLELDVGSPNCSEGPPSTPEYRGQPAIYVGSATSAGSSWSNDASRVARGKRS